LEGERGGEALDEAPGEEAFTAFVREHERRIWQAVAPIAGPDAANDAVAHAFGVAWRNWRRVSTMENPAGYVYRTAARAARPRRRVLRIPLAAPEPARLPDVEPRLAPALASLSEMQRTVVFLVEAWQWTQAEAASLLGISPSTVGNHHARAMARLRRALEVDADVRD
jgi:RNA polymerase sigma factor (sigma-70 family)